MQCTLMKQVSISLQIGRNMTEFNVSPWLGTQKKIVWLPIKWDTTNTSLLHYTQITRPVFPQIGRNTNRSPWLWNKWNFVRFTLRKKIINTHIWMPDRSPRYKSPTDRSPMDESPKDKSPKRQKLQRQKPQRQEPQETKAPRDKRQKFQNICLTCSNQKLF